MKKLIATALVLILIFALTACGGKTDPTPSGGTADPGSQQTVKGKLYDIKDEQIGTSERDADYSYTKVEGEKRAEMLAAFPKAMKKGIGEIKGCSISGVEGYTNCTVGLQFRVDADSDYKTLTEYYKSLGGTVTGESDSMLTMDFDWGTISQCDYLTSSKKITVTFSVQTSGTPSGAGGSDNISDIDFSKILTGNGATDVVYGELTAIQKQAIIDEAKKDGVDVSFSADGSMTVKDTDGTVIVQKPDGTWTYKDEQGGESQLGGKWPDNEFTKLIPKPNFTLTAASVEGESFVAMFANVSEADARAYIEKVKTAGFNSDIDLIDESYCIDYTAKNASNGYKITVSVAFGIFTVEVSK